MCRTSNRNATLLRIGGLILFVSFLLVAIGHREAWAAKYSITIARTPSSPAVVLTMGNAIAGTMLSYDVTNRGTGGNLYQIDFTVPSGYTLAAATLPGDAPAGWTTAVLSNGNRTMTFATTQNGASTIPRNAMQTFILRLNSVAVPALIQDGTVALATVKATYDNGKAATLSNAASSSWSVKSLAVVGFTAIDSVTGQQATVPGGTLTVTLTLANRSTGNWTGIISVPQPPAVAAVWSTGNAAVTTISSPAISLNAGQTGNLVWIFAVGGACGGANSPSGSVTFSVTSARNGTNTATAVSATATSNSVAIGCFTGNIGPSQTCVTSGANITITMNLTNQFNNNIAGITAPADPGGSGTAARTRVSGPTFPGGTTAAPPPPSPPPPLSVTWVYTITGAPGQTFLFSGGTVTGTLQAAPPKTVTASITPSPAGNIVSQPTVTPSPATIPSDKNRMVDISWSFDNKLCNPVSQVAIAVPAGWMYLDGSALITNNGAAYDDWSVNTAGSVVTFTGGTSIVSPVTGVGNGTFTLFFSQTPNAQANYAFPVVITDSVMGPLPAVNTTVAVGAAAGSGMAPAGLWGEEIK
jgi:hypothetical protein